MKIAAAVALAVVCCTVASLASSDHQSAFTEWMQKHSKSYTSSNFNNKFEVFKNNFDAINAHNSNKGDNTFELGLNEFSDLTHAEFISTHTGYIPPVHHGSNDENEVDPNLPVRHVSRSGCPSGYPVLCGGSCWSGGVCCSNVLCSAGTTCPASGGGCGGSVPLGGADTVYFNWTAQGIVTPVKNQGGCGCCWAFSTTGAVEAAYAKSKSAAPVSLSEQNLVDCSTSNNGCGGGNPSTAMSYIINNHGIDTGASYPFTMTNPGNTIRNTCAYSSAHIGATISKVNSVARNSESALQTAVQLTPVSVAIDASQATFNSYKSGVYNDAKCSNTSLDHAVLVVGYGTDASAGDYWIVKNSWGTSWGLHGYFLLARNNNNKCGVAAQASYPTV